MELARTHRPLDSSTVQATSFEPPGTSLYRDFFDRNQREEGGGGHGFPPRLGDDSDNEKPNDIESRVLVPGRGKLGAAHERCGSHAASSRVVLRGIDSADGGLGIAVIQGNESLHLFLRIADEVRADFDLLHLCRNSNEEKQWQENQCKPQRGTHGNLRLAHTGLPNGCTLEGQRATFPRVDEGARWSRCS